MKYIFAIADNNFYKNNTADFKKAEAFPANAAVAAAFAFAAEITSFMTAAEAGASVPVSTPLLWRI